jgi:GR25 family glycosyltransferase involved in LPS biosynthesis
MTDITFNEWLETAPLTWHNEFIVHNLVQKERHYAEYINIGYLIYKEWVGTFSIYIYKTDGIYPLDRFVDSEYYMSFDNFQLAKQHCYFILFELLQAAESPKRVRTWGGDT